MKEAFIIITVIECHDLNSISTIFHLACLFLLFILLKRTPCTLSASIIPRHAGPSRMKKIARASVPTNQPTVHK